MSASVRRIRQSDLSSARRHPYAVVLQSHCLIGLETTRTAPLVIAAALPADGKLGLAVEFEGNALTLSMQQLASIPISLLRRPLGSLIRYDFEIARAWQRLFTGF